MRRRNVLIIGSSVVSLAVLAIVILMIRRASDETKDRAAKTYAAGDIVMRDDRANNFGVTSKGTTQTRGNGTLVLTKNELHFFAIAGDDVRIPLADITGVDFTTSHLGKSYGSDLVLVRFKGSSGEDSVAWAVQDAKAWRSKLEERVNKR